MEKSSKLELEDRKEAKVKINTIFNENSRASVLMRKMHSVVRSDSISGDIRI